MPREPALGVAHRRRAVAVERSEIARAVDQRIAQREGLRHAHERFVDRRVAVRVIAPHDVAHDLRALAVLGVGRQPLLPHRVENAALHRLQPVAHIRQRARRDDRQRVVQVPRLRGFVQRNGRFAAAITAAHLRHPRAHRNRRSHQRVYVSWPSCVVRLRASGFRSPRLQAGPHVASVVGRR